MSEYSAVINWVRSDSELFSDNKYSRGHTWRFDGGAIVHASSAPQVVPVPLSVEANVDPEEAFVASLSSCHMLWFLYLAADKKYVVDAYEDKAIGTMAKNTEGKLAMTEVILRPYVSGNIPEAELKKIHHEAHEKCFIANSVKTNVKIEMA
jgi:organic hydroperoxide reductase OsmC/OhrA